MGAAVDGEEARAEGGGVAAPTPLAPASDDPSSAPAPPRRATAVMGDYVAQHAARGALPRAAEPALLLALPPWWVAGPSHFLAAVADANLFGNGSAGGGTFRAALERFLGDYAAALYAADAAAGAAGGAAGGARGGAPLYGAFLAALGCALPALASAKGAFSAVLAALGAARRAPAGEGLDAPAPLAALRAALLAHAARSGRGEVDATGRLAARVVFAHARVGAPPPAAGVALVGHVLACLPAAVVLDAAAGAAWPGGGAPADAPSVLAEGAAWIVGGDDGAGGGAATAESSLATAIAAYLAPTPAPPLASSAASLARLLVLAGSGVGGPALDRLLAPLGAALSRAGHPYAPRAPAARALLLLKATLAAAFPGGGSGDAHAHRSVAGPAVPPGWPAPPDPTHAEWAAANRALAAAFPPAPPAGSVDALLGGGGGAGGADGPAPDALAAVSEGLGEAPGDEMLHSERLPPPGGDEELDAIVGDIRALAPRGAPPASSLPLTARRDADLVLPLRAALFRLLASELLASDVAALAEGALAPGLRLATDEARGWWGVDLVDTLPPLSATSLFAGGGGTTVDAPAGASPPPRLTTTFFLVLLRDTLRLSPPPPPFVAAAGRLIAAAGAGVAPPAVAAPAGGAAPDAGAAAAVQHAHSCHVLAVLLDVLLPLLPAGTPPLGPERLALLRALLGPPMARPPGASDPALPLPPRAPGTPDSRGEGGADVSWLSLRALAERARWAAVEALVRCGERRGWAGGDAPPARAPRSPARLPPADADALATGVLDALDGAGSAGGEAAVLLRLAGKLLPFAAREGEGEGKGEGEGDGGGSGAGAGAPGGVLGDDDFIDDEEGVVDPSQTTAGDAPRPPALCVSVREVLSGMAAVALTPRRSRADVLAFAGALFSSGALGARALHAPGGPVTAAAARAWAYLSDDAAAPHCAQLFAARALAGWAGALAGVRGAPRAPRARALAAALAAAPPLLTAFCLHRELTLPWEDSAAVDTHSRAQMLAWLQARPAGGRGYFRDAAGALLDELEDVAAAAGAGAGVHSGARAGAAATPVFASRRPDAAATLPARGAGALTRVQALAFVEALGAWCAERDAPAAARRLLAAVALRLAGVQATREWLRDVAAGSPSHCARLRAWQALALIAGRLGAVSGAAGGGDAGAAADGTRQSWGGVEHAYSAWADAWLPVGAAARAPADGGRSGDAGGDADDDDEGGSSARAARAATAYADAVIAAFARGGPGAAAAASSAAAAAVGGHGRGGAPPAFTAALLLAAGLRVTLAQPQSPSIRHYVEVACAALASRFPALAARAHVLPLLAEHNPRSQRSFSLVLIAAAALRRLSAAAVAAAARAAAGDAAAARAAPTLALLARTLLSSVFCWVASPIGLTRVVACVAVADGAGALFGAAAGGRGEGLPALARDAAGVAAWVRPLTALLAGSDEIFSIGARLRVVVARAASPDAGGLDAVLTSPVTEHGELVPADTFSAVRDAFRSVATRLYRDDPLNTEEEDAATPDVRAAVRAGALPARALIDERVRGALASAGATGDGAGAGARLAAASSAPFQRKAAGGAGVGDGSADAVVGGAGGAVAAPRNEGVAALSARAYDAAVASALADHAARARNSSGEGGAGEPTHSPAAAAAAADAAAMVAAAGGGGGAHAATLAAVRRATALLDHVAPSGRRFQPLVIVASLVDRAPNLGGLARTAEVFSAEALVVRDVRVTADPAFRDTSVSAASWLDIRACAPTLTAIRALLAARRTAGYAVVALEQASRSVPLGRAALPDRCVLLLGAEKEGVPPELLAEADVVVEIPQTGVIRSLNVHVSAALLVWEYTRQRIERARRA